MPSPEDAPLTAAYVDQVAARAQRLRQRSRWLNAVSVEATAAQLDGRRSPAVRGARRLVRRYRMRAKEPLEPEPASARSASAGATARKASALVLDYGSSRGQLEQIGVPAVHELGYSGQGVVVAVFDTGFNALAHEVFSSTRILAMHDFVNGDDDVSDHGDHGNGDHGTATLSVLGGRLDGQLVGPAFGADFILAKTENTDSETPVEEDNWAAAAEWAEALGADVISSSLGYLEYDSPFPSHTFNDMNGVTAVSTRAAEMAAARGVVVVNSAGNAARTTRTTRWGLRPTARTCWPSARWAPPARAPPSARSGRPRTAGSSPTSPHRARASRSRCRAASTATARRAARPSRAR